MILRIELGSTPPTLALVEPEDLGSFRAQVVLGPHTWIAPESLESLGPEDPEWRERLGATIAYAREQGWTDPQGNVRAHVEVIDGPGPGEDPR